VTFNNLYEKPMIIISVTGGLGNQMFQYAVARALSIKENKALVVDVSGISLDKNPNKKPLDLFGFRLSNSIIVIRNKWISRSLRHSLLLISKLLKLEGYYREFRERDVSKVLEDLIADKSKHKFLNGVWACNSYSATIRNELVSDFTPLRSLSGPSMIFLEQIKSCQSVSVHVRRGDFAKNGCFTVGPAYFEAAAKLLKEKLGFPLTFFVFSDSLGWARDNILLGENVVFVDGNEANALEDFELMSSCKHHVISASTFSWWAARLASMRAKETSKVIIAPASWWSVDLNYRDVDIYPTSWHKIDVH
jgi:hypothetical protein